MAEDSSELIRVVQDLELFESSDGDSSDEDGGDRCSSCEASEEGSEDESIGWKKDEFQSAQISTRSDAKSVWDVRATRTRKQDQLTHDDDQCRRLQGPPASSQSTAPRSTAFSPPLSRDLLPFRPARRARSTKPPFPSP